MEFLQPQEKTHYSAISHHQIPEGRKVERPTVFSGKNWAMKKKKHLLVGKKSFFPIFRFHGMGGTVWFNYLILPLKENPQKIRQFFGAATGRASRASKGDLFVRHSRIWCYHGMKITMNFTTICMGNIFVFFVSNHHGGSMGNVFDFFFPKSAELRQI